MLKREFDMIASLAGGLLISPLYIGLYLLIRIKMGKPIFFKQQRPGLNEKIFRLIKFRTMNNNRDKNGDLCSDEERITKLGRLLRSSSLDELPELFNVIKGEMSLVGPRPLLVEYLSYYTEEQKQRHRVRPGITGLAQVYGRNDLSWDEKLELDVWYVKNQSFFLDLKILFLTMFVVIKREGISHGETVGMPRFDKQMKEK